MLFYIQWKYLVFKIISQFYGPNIRLLGCMLESFWTLRQCED